jgi:hypothetical protein
VRGRSGGAEGHAVKAPLQPANISDGSSIFFRGSPAEISFIGEPGVVIGVRRPRGRKENGGTVSERRHDPPACSRPSLRCRAARVVEIYICALAVEGSRRSGAFHVGPLVGDLSARVVTKTFVTDSGLAGAFCRRRYGNNSNSRTCPHGRLPNRSCHCLSTMHQNRFSRLACNSSERCGSHNR